MARNCTLTPHSWLDKLGEIKDELVQMYGDNSVTNIEENNAIMDQSTEDDPDYKNVLKAVKSMTAEDLESFKGICYSDKDLTNDKGVELNDSTKLHNIASKIASWILQEREVRNPRLGGSDSRLYGTLPTSSILAGIFDDIYFIYGNNEKTRAIRNALLKLNSFIPNSTPFDKVFNPNSTNEVTFDESDTKHIVKLLVQTYLNNSEAFVNIKTYRNFKNLLIEKLKDRIEIARQSTIRTAYHDKHTIALFNELEQKSSSIYNQFTMYMKINYGKDVTKFKHVKRQITDKTEEEIDASGTEEVINRWDEDAKLSLDLRTTLSSRAKIFIAKNISKDMVNNRATKYYLADPVDINSVWNKLINMYSGCVSLNDFYNKTRAITKHTPELKPLLDLFESVIKGNAQSNDVAMVKTIMTSIGSLSKTKVIIARIEDSTAEINKQNRDSFPEELAMDNLRDAIKSANKSDVYKNFVVKSESYNRFINDVNALQNSIQSIENIEDYENLAIRQSALLESLKIDIPASVLAIHYEYGDLNLEVIKSKLSRINGLIKNIAMNIANRGKSDPIDNIQGYLYELACVKAMAFDAHSSMTYLDVNGQLNYTPQYDSLLTRFTKGWVVNGQVNLDAVVKSFEPYLNDPTVNFGDNNNPLISHENRGIFEKKNGKWVVTSRAAEAIKNGNLFDIFQFNGIKLGEKGFKYREVQGGLFAYTMYILAANNQFLMLTADSPRSYTITYEPTKCDDLFINENRSLIFEDVDGRDVLKEDSLITNGAINLQSQIVKELSYIVKSDINRLNIIKDKLLSDFPINKYNNKTYAELSEADKIKLKKYHNVKYCSNKNNEPAIYKDGYFVGRAFQFLNLTYSDGVNNHTFLTYLKTEHPEVDIIKDSYKLNDYVEGLVSKYIQNVINVDLPKTETIADAIWGSVKSARDIYKYDAALIKEDTENRRKQKIAEIEEEYRTKYPDKSIDEIRNLKSYKREVYVVNETAKGITDDKIDDIKDTYTSDNYRLFIIETILNRTIASHFYSEIFQGNLDEYSDSVDFNKRVAQTIKNGLNSVNPFDVELVVNEDGIQKEQIDPVRKVLVIEDWNFGSNIASLLFNEKTGIKNETLKEKHSKSEKINDSQSFITDKGLEALLRATGRWHTDEPLYKYITDLRDPNKSFDPTTYGKLVEQLKLFGTARRTRREFMDVYEDDDILGDEVDSIQIKDSTVVLFKPMVKGSDLEFVYDDMVRAGIHQLSPISAVKVSGITPYKIHNEKGAYIPGSILNTKNTSYSTLKMYHSDFVIQQDIPADILDEEVILGNQLVKQIMEGLAWNEAIYTLDGKPATGAEIFREFQNILTTNIEEDFLKLFFNIVDVDDNGFISLDKHKGIVLNKTKLIQIFQEHITTDNQASNIRKMLKVNSLEDFEKGVALDNPIIFGKIESIITSMFNKAIANKYLSGFHTPIRADIFTVHGELIDHRDIYTLPTDDEKTADEKKSKYDAILEEYTTNGAISWSNDFIEKCKNEKRPLTLRAEHRTENGQDVYYAEVITSAWMSEFFTNIGETKTIKTDSGSKTIHTIDLNKIDKKGRQMLGIRIPTEGKQSMVVFEVVGILNTGASQTIFPQTLVNRTGWDFDIDSIYAYYHALKFDGTKYKVVEFQSKFDEENGQKKHNFYSSLLENENRIIDLEYHSSRTAKTPIDSIIQLLNYNQYDKTKGVLNQIVKSIDTYISTTDDISDETIIKLNSLRKIVNRIIHNRTNYTTDNNTFKKYDIDVNQYNYARNTIKDKHSLIPGLNKHLTRIANDLDLIVDLAGELNIESINDSINNIKEVSKLIPYFKEGVKEEIKKQLINIQDSKPSDIIRGFLENIDAAKDSRAEVIKNGVLKDVDNIYMSNSRSARDNRLLDIMIEVHTNKYHAEEVNKPNAMDELRSISDSINSDYQSDIKRLNPHNFYDAITLNNMSMGSTTLKGHSVNFDSYIAVLSTVNARLTKDLYHPVHIEDMPIPEGFTKNQMYSEKNGVYTLHEKYKKYLDSHLGTYTAVVDGVKKLVHRYDFNSNTGVLNIRDQYINNNAENTHTDLSGSRIELQMNQWTSAILDILKSNLGFNVNTDTLSIARVLSMGNVIEQHNGSNNRFTYAMLFIHQPIIVDMIDYLNIQRISDPYFNIDKSFDKIYSDLINDIVDNYLKIVETDPSYKLKYHDLLISLHNKTHTRIGDLIKHQVKNDSKDKVSFTDMINMIGDKLGTLSNVTRISQTSRDLQSNIDNRNATEVKQSLVNNIRQLNVLHAFHEYKGMTDDLVNLQFILKSESKSKNFYGVDYKVKQIADYYYSIKSLGDELGSNYEASLIAMQNIAIDNSEIETDFYTMPLEQYRKKYDIKDDSFLNFLGWKAAKQELVYSNDLQSRIEFTNKYGLIRAKNKPVVLPDDSDIVSSIFPQIDTPIINEDGSFNTENISSYSVIQSRYRFNTDTVHSLFDTTFILRNKVVRYELDAQIYSAKTFISDKTRKNLNEAIINEFVNISIPNVDDIIKNNHTDSYKLILGVPDAYFKDSEAFNESQNEIKSKLGNLVTFGDKEFKLFDKLTLHNKIEFLRNNRLFKAYLKDPIFNNHNIFNHISFGDNIEKVGYETIKLDVKEDNDDISDSITNSIAYMWNSSNPFIAHTIRQFIMHTYITKGIRYGFDVGKYIPTEIISRKLPNYNYDKIIKSSKVIDVAENIHLYNERLITINAILNNNPYDINVKDVIKKAISKNGNLVIRTPKSKQRYAIWMDNPYEASMGCVMGKTKTGVTEDGKDIIKEYNIAQHAYVDGNGNTKVLFFEREDRLINSKYSNVELVKDYYYGKPVVYKKYKVTPTATLPQDIVYAFIPIGKTLLNESNIGVSKTNSIIDKYDVINKVKIKDTDGNETLVDIEDYVLSLSGAIEDFKTAIDEAQSKEPFRLAGHQVTNDSEEPVSTNDEPGNITNDDEVDSEDLTFNMPTDDAIQIYKTNEIPIRNLISKKGSLLDAITDVINDSNNSVYITRSGRVTHTPTGSLNLHNNFNERIITVDYTKSPEDEARRIAKLLKKGSLYLNGDILADTELNFEQMYFWTQTFIDNLSIVAPQIDVIKTIVNNGFGEAVARSGFKGDKININIYDSEEELYAEVLVHDPTINPIRNAYIHNGSIAISLMNSVRKIGRFFERNHADIRLPFKKLLDKFDDIDGVEYNLETSLEDADRSIVTETLSQMVELANLIMSVCEIYHKNLRDNNFEEIRNNYGKVQDYKRELNELLDLLGHFDKYINLQKIDINDTRYDPDNEEDVQAYHDEYDELNKAIDKLQNLHRKSKQIKNDAINAIKRTIIWRVIDESRNPKYTTSYSKLLDYLEAHDYDVSNLKPEDLDISEQEWLEMESFIFALDKDITKVQAIFDSALATGNTLVDMVGKAFTQAHDEAVEYSHKRMRDLENILESYQPGLFKDRAARTALMREFVDEEGNFIGTYDTTGVSAKIYTLKEKISNTIAEGLDKNQGQLNEQSAIEIGDKINQIIDDFNNDNKEKFELEILTYDVAKEHYAEMENLTSKQRLIYLQTNGLVETEYMDAAGRISHNLYKINYTEAAKSEAFKRLTPEKQRVLQELKNLINRIIYDFDPTWVNPHGAYDSFIPYLPKATLASALKSYISIPQIHRDKTYETISGSTRYILSAETLKVPKVYYKFPFKGKNAKTFGETKVAYNKRMVEAFNEWRIKNDVLKLSKEATSIEDIYHFNEQIALANRKEKAKTMSYDIVDIMTGFTQELSNLQAVNNFYLDYELSKIILNTDNGNGTPMSKLTNLAKQYTNLEKRVVDVSSTNTVLDQLAGGLLRYTSVSFMYLNYTAGITNILKGITDSITYTTANGLVGGKDFIKRGLNEVLKSVIPFISDLNSLKTDNLNVAIIKHFDAIYQDTRDVTSSLTGTNAMVKILKYADTLGYLPNTMGEFIMQYGMLLACTESHRVVAGKIMAFQDFFRTNLENKLMKVLTNEQKQDYDRFVEHYNKEIEAEEKRTGVEYMWDHDYASAYIKANLAKFDNETKEKLVKLINDERNKAREAFNKYPILKSQFELQDGQLAFKEGSGLTKTELSNFRSRVKSINQSLHGIYNRLDRNSLQDNAFGNLLMQFKKWVRPNLIRLVGRRFGQIFYNEQLGAYEVPVYNVMFDMFRNGKSAFLETRGDNKDFLNNLKAIAGWFRGVASFIHNIKFYYNTLPTHEQVAAVQFAKTMGAVILAFLSTALIAGIHDDDDKDENKFYTHIAYIFTSWYQELVSLLIPFGILSFIKQTSDNVFAGEKILTTVGSLAALAAKSLWADDEDMIYDRGVYKGEHKMWVKTKQLIPILRQINKYQHLGQTMSWYHMYNFMGNPSDIFYNFANFFTRKVFDYDIEDGYGSYDDYED